MQEKFGESQGLNREKQKQIRKLFEEYKNVFGVDFYVKLAKGKQSVLATFEKWKKKKQKKESKVIVQMGTQP